MVAVTFRRLLRRAPQWLYADTRSAGAKPQSPNASTGSASRPDCQPAQWRAASPNYPAGKTDASPPTATTNAYSDVSTG